jgi:hypothetical protein
VPSPRPMSSPASGSPTCRRPPRRLSLLRGILERRFSVLANGCMRSSHAIDPFANRYRRSVQRHEARHDQLSRRLAKVVSDRPGLIEFEIGRTYSNCSRCRPPVPTRATNTPARATIPSRAGAHPAPVDQRLSLCAARLLVPGTGLGASRPVDPITDRVWRSRRRAGTARRCLAASEGPSCCRRRVAVCHRQGHGLFIGLVVASPHPSVCIRSEPVGSSSRSTCR